MNNATSPNHLYSLESTLLWPQRDHIELHEELHSRPAMSVRTPSVISYWAQKNLSPDLALLAMTRLCLDYGVDAPQSGAKHHVLLTPRFDLRLELHGEFVSWQMSSALIIAGLPDDSKAWHHLLEHDWANHLLPAAFLQVIGHAPMVAATHIFLLPAPTPDWLSACQLAIRTQLDSAGNVGDAAAILAGQIFFGRASVLTSLQLGKDGFTRFVLFDHGLPSDRAARDVQRLCEIEAYRMLAMLGFPVAQTESIQLQKIEIQLQTIVNDMANARELDDDSAFNQLLHLAAEIEHCSARARFRLSASRAYHRIMLQRLSDLHLERIDGLQKLSGFFNRRFTPAMNLCESTDARITDLAQRIGRAVDLARLRVEARREASNQEVLKSLARRQRMQLQLQQTVEGLSVVAISYYALGLVSYVAKVFKGVSLVGGRHLEPELITGFSVVPVLWLVYTMVHKVRKQLFHKETSKNNN